MEKSDMLVGTFISICLCLCVFLISYFNIGFHGATVYFHFPALTFCVGLFIASIIMYFNSKHND